MQAGWGGWAPRVDKNAGRFTVRVCPFAACEAGAHIPYAINADTQFMTAKGVASGAGAPAQCDDRAGCETPGKKRGRGERR
ncbi:hypothetical protein KCP70_11155 [Salmonella enterica subsp. enterica]|nr:hypothetical protein KCP70_11155 [Salmonella enterica subsp. enterica]